MHVLALLPLFRASESPVVRDLRPGIERHYRIVVDQDGGDHYAYRFEAKVIAPKVPKGVKAAVHLQFKLTDYRATMGGQSVSSKLIGGGEVPFDPTGLPAGLNIAGPQGPIWLPLLCLYVPTSDDSEFDVSRIGVGTGLEIAGKGSFAKKRGGREVALEVAVSRAGSKVGDLKITTVLDAEGWPQRAEGSLVSQDGTYRFTLR